MGHSGWKAKINLGSHLTRHPVNKLLIFFWTNVFPVLEIPFSVKLFAFLLALIQRPSWETSFFIIMKLSGLFLKRKST